MLKSRLLRIMQHLYRYSSRCTKLISVTKTLQSASFDANLVVGLKCKVKFKTWKNVAISIFGAKNAQNRFLLGKSTAAAFPLEMLDTG